ncbi:MAG: ABC transporter permease, partial [Acidobacteria bacterium]|nr:ABC transporter permease [Acidobacteriota bacterium]
MFRRLIARIRHRRFADDLDAELDEHRAMLEDDLRRRGSTVDDARVEAQRVLGRDVSAREDARAVWLPPLFDQTMQDVRFAWRQMRKAPGFALTAIALCALGVGATTAIVSVINALLIAPLPYPDADRVLALGSSNDGAAVSGEHFAAVKRRSTTLGELAAQRTTGGWSLDLGGRAEAVSGLRVSQQYFAVLGVPPQMGRAFTADEDREPGPAVVIISHDVWQRALGGASDAIGRTITLSGTPHEVVGVMPARFTSFPAADVWTPLRLSNRDNSLNYLALARLAPGQTLQAAAAELELSKADLLLTQPDAMHRRIRALSWAPLSRVLSAPLTLPLLLLTLTAVVTVGIACANLSGLLLFRTLARGQEMATRLALGGSPARIVRQLLTESLLLAAIGGVAGMLAARAALPIVASFIPAALLAGRTVTIDATVITLSVLATLMITIAFGLAPALTTRRFELTVLTSQRTQTTSRRQSWARRGVLIGEIAATTTLVLIGVILARTLVQAYRADLGFNPDAVTVGHLSLPETFGAAPDRFASFADRTLAQLRQNPAVLSAALANHVPIERGLNLAVEPPPGG